MTYVLVFSPDGEPFEVTRERADHLILNEGWTQSLPSIREAKPEAPSEASDKAPGEGTKKSLPMRRRPALKRLSDL